MTDLGESDIVAQRARDELQDALSRAVELARELPMGAVDRRYDALVGVYVTQIVGGVLAARSYIP